MSKPKYQPAIEIQLRMHEVFSDVVRSNREFSADTVYLKLLESKIPLLAVRKTVSNLFKVHKAAGAISQSDRYVASTRGRKRPIPIWISKTAASAAKE